MSHSTSPHQKKKNKNSFHSESRAHTARGLRLSRSPEPEAISSRGLAQGWMLKAEAGRGAQRGAPSLRGLRAGPAAARRLPLAPTAPSAALTLQTWRVPPRPPQPLVHYGSITPSATFPFLLQHVKMHNKD